MAPPCDNLRDTHGICLAIYSPTLLQTHDFFYSAEHKRYLVLGTDDFNPHPLSLHNLRPIKAFMAEEDPTLTVYICYSN